MQRERTTRPTVGVFTAAEAAEASFKRGATKDGIASLNHALWIALTRPEEVSAKDARALYNRIERAADVWGQE